jgi:excisionase family DNA binding protein
MGRADLIVKVAQRRNMLICSERFINFEAHMLTLTETPLPPLRASLRQAAQILGISYGFIYRKVQAGELKAHRDGKKSFVTTDELRDYVARQEQAALIAANTPKPPDPPKRPVGRPRKAAVTA